MYVIREILNCKPGKVGALREKFEAISSVMERLYGSRLRLLTDVTGEPFWTLVSEMEVESLDDFLNIEEGIMSDDEAKNAMTGYHDLVDSGRREIYKVVS